jgi:hypothetical protein
MSTCLLCNKFSTYLDTSTSSYILMLLYRHTYLQPELHYMYVFYLFFSARVMVGLASPPLEAGAWLAVDRRPLGRRLPPREPLRVCPRRRDRAEHEACLALRELHLQMYRV